MFARGPSPDIRTLVPDAATTATGRASHWPLLALLALALAVRVTAIFAFPSLHYPDEAYQLLEQGHRLTFGYGVKPWEFEDSLRSMVVPYLLAGLFAVSEPVFGGPEGYLRFTQIVLAVLSLAPVAAAYQTGRRIGPTHGLMAGLVAATWFEMVYFAFRPLTEALAVDVVLVALALASVPFETMTRRRVMAIGFCLGLAAMLRIHLAPGLLLIALWVVRLEFRTRWTPLVLGAAAPLLVFGLTDWVTWGSPFSSTVNAVWVNAGQNKASLYGVSSPYWYGSSFLRSWGPALVPLGLLIAVRWRSSMLWIGFAALVLASHSLIPHKEYRFIFPAIAGLVVVAGLGSGDVVERLRARYGAARTRGLAALVAGLWVALSVGLALTPHNARQWTNARDAIRASFWLSHQPGLCGLALYDDRWVNTGGYAFLHRDVPVYPLRVRHADAHRSTGAFNYVLARRSDAAGFAPAYRIAWCATAGTRDGACLLERPGACVATPALTPLVRMPRLGEAKDDG